MVHVHRDVFAGRGRGEGVTDEHQDIAMVIAGEGQRGESVTGPVVAMPSKKLTSSPLPSR